MAKTEMKSIVVAQFDSKSKAEAAADSLKSWDKANDSIKLGAIQIISSDDGKVKNEKHGKRNTGHGAKVGTIVGVVAGVLSGGLTLVGGAIGGAVLGTVLGSLRKKGFKISDDELKKMQSWLDGGKALLVVICEESEMAATSEELTSLGAIETKDFAVTEDAYKALDAAAEKATAAAPAADADAQVEAATAEVAAAATDEAPAADAPADAAPEAPAA